MTSKTLQQILKIIVLQILIVIPILQVNPLIDNYTAVMNHSNTLLLFVICDIPVLFYLFYLLFQNGKKYHIKHWNIQLFLFMILIISVIFIPYHETEDFLSGLHVMMGYITFIVFSLMIYQLTTTHIQLRYFYFAGIILAIFITMTFGCINGLAEALFACITSIVLLMI